MFSFRAVILQQTEAVFSSSDIRKSLFIHSFFHFKHPALVNPG